MNNTLLKTNEESLRIFPGGRGGKVEIQDIKIFMAVAKLGGVSSAAEHLGYVQSNVTTRIRAIEKELGCPLFNRHWRGMTLNAEGYKFLIFGEKIVKLMDELNDAFQDEDDPSGILRIGLVETISDFPKILSSFHKKYKKIELSILSGVSKDLIQEVLNGRLDGAFVAGPVEVPHIEEIPVFEEEVVLVCSKVAEEFQNIQSTNELLQQPLLLFKEGCAYRSRIYQWAYASGTKPGKIMEFGTLETIMGTLVSGLGVSLLSRKSVEKLEREGLVQLFTVPYDFQFIKFVYIRRSDAYMGLAEQKFIDELQSIK